MSRMLILGANGQLARHVTGWLLKKSDLHLTLYARRSHRLKNPDPDRVTIVEGDVLDQPTLEKAMVGQDIVYANLSGNMADQARVIVPAMKNTELKRLIFISSMGIYGEVPGERYKSILDPYRDSAAVIEESDLDYTILRPGWFDRQPSVSYQLTTRDQPFQGHDISLDSLAHLIQLLASDPTLHVRASLGVSRV